MTAKVSKGVKMNFKTTSERNELYREIFLAIKNSDVAKPKTFYSYLHEWDHEKYFLPTNQDSKGFVFDISKIREKDNIITCLLNHGYPQDLCGGIEKLTFKRIGSNVFLENIEPEIVY